MLKESVRISVRSSLMHANLFINLTFNCLYTRFVSLGILLVVFINVAIKCLNPYAIF